MHPDHLRIGLEFDFRHAVQARVGRLFASGGYDDVSTYGLGMSVRGLVSLLTRGRSTDELRRGPDIQLAFAGVARKTASPMDGTSFFGLELKL